MQPVVWDASYEVGHPVFDQEHHRLVDLINRLLSLNESSAAHSEMAAVLGELVDYSETHFAHEEEEMIRCAVDRRHQLMHVAAHRAFEREARALKTKPIEGLSVPSLVKLLVDWLVGHIVAHDRVMVRQLVAIRAGHSPAQAYTECHMAVQAAAGVTSAASVISNAVDARVASSEVLLEQIVEGAPVATLVLGLDRRVMYWNRACAHVTGVPAHRVVGTTDAWRGFYAEPRPILANLILEPEVPLTQIQSLYGEACQPSGLVPGAYECEQFFPALGDGGKWLHFTAAPLCDASGHTIGAIETLEDITEYKRVRQKLI